MKPVSSTPFAVERQRAVLVEPQLAVDAATQPVLRGLVAAVDLRAVPPVGHLVDERDRGLLAGSCRVGSGWVLPTNMLRWR